MSTDDRLGSPVSDVVASLPWIQGPEDVSDDTGDTTWGLAGPPNAEAQQAADDKYFGRNHVVKDADGHIVVEYPMPEPAGFEVRVSLLYNDAQAVLLSKHSDYGPKNISDAPGGALNGLRVRMHDKMARINNLIDSGATPENESLRDSFLDLANYSIIAMMVIDGTWPGVER